ncbi:MAG TPA: PAC2 family protein [Jatrophihabitans sp.]|jgi:predicted ATP-grasp superfamily ATP-dependent carboligase|uniref:PAC2 family protein n=1 Tax=Jatrophihabitans sp. TaxID=1932789 RepID=UPI002EFD1AB1
MLDPAKLFELIEELPELDRPVLVLALDGFVDAGNASQLTRSHLLSTLESQVIATFDIDQVFDYRGRRPEMLFVTDHWERFAAPELKVHAVRDAAGTQFLLLAGAEPDMQWERFTAAVQLIVERLGVRLLIALNAIPMGVPHTRPSTVIAHASRPDLVIEYSNWLGTVQVPGSAAHLIEFRLGVSGLDTMGFAVNVPHYLAHLDYPAAALTLIECVAKASGLVLPTEILQEAARESRIDLDAKVAASEQVSAVVHALESQYDEIVAGRTHGLVADGARLPTADELGAEFEQYLLQQQENPDAQDPGDEAGA